MLVSTVAGLWAYNTGATIRFISKKPYKILFSGRASQYCSAFGEHVIEKEVQLALKKTIDEVGGAVTGFSVCPKVLSKPGQSHHMWFVEFLRKPDNLIVFEKLLNKKLEEQNIYYKVQPCFCDSCKKDGCVFIDDNSYYIDNYNNYF